MGNESDDSRLFTSATVSSEELLGRARARLRATAAPRDTPAGDAGSVEIDVESGAGLLGGWYHAERYYEVPVRWTQRYFDFDAEVGAATHIDMEALLPEESGFAELRARLWVNDSVGDAFRIRQGWNRVLVPIPAGVSGPAHFSFDAGGAWCPLEQSVNEDGRELGICVRRLALVRLELPHTVATRARGVSALAPSVTAAGAAAPLGQSPAATAIAAPRGFDALRALGRVVQLEQRIGGTESGIAGIEPRLGGVEARLSDLEGRLQSVEAALGEVERGLSALVSVLERRLVAIEEAHRELRADVAAPSSAPSPRRKP